MNAERCSVAPTEDSRRFLRLVGPRVSPAVTASAITAPRIREKITKIHAELATGRILRAPPVRADRQATRDSHPPPQRCAQRPPGSRSPLCAEGERRISTPRCRFDRESTRTDPELAAPDTASADCADSPGECSHCRHDRITLSRQVDTARQRPGCSATPKHSRSSRLHQHCVVVDPECPRADNFQSAHFVRPPLWTGKNQHGHIVPLVHGFTRDEGAGPHVEQRHDVRARCNHLAVQRDGQELTLEFDSYHRRIVFENHAAPTIAGVRTD